MPEPSTEAGRTLRVALVTNDYGGVFTCTWQLAEQLRRLGVRVEIVVHPADPSPSSSGTEQLRASCDALHVAPRIAEAEGQVRVLASLLRSVGADLLVPNFRETTYAACARLSRRTPARILGICHNDHESYYHLLERYAPILDGFVAPAAVVAESLRRRLPHRAGDVRYIPYGVAIADPPANGYQGGEIRLVYHGRVIEEQKRLSRLLDVAGTLAARGVAFRLRIVGDGPDRERYREEVRARGLLGRIEFLDHRPWSMLIEILRESHVAVLTSQYEGLCLSLAEAMGAGLPAVAFACGGVIEEYLTDGHNGFVVPQDDVIAMADRIQWFQQNPGRWPEFSARARAVICQRYSREEFGRRYFEFIRELTTEDGRRRRWPRLRPARAAPGPAARVIERCGRWFGFWGSSP